MDNATKTLRDRLEEINENIDAFIEESSEWDDLDSDTETFLRAVQANNRRTLEEVGNG